MRNFIALLFLSIIMFYLNLTPIVRLEREFFSSISTPGNTFFASIYKLYIDVYDTGSKIYYLRSENAKLNNKITDLESEVVRLNEIIKTNSYVNDQKKYSERYNFIVSNIIGNKNLDSNNIIMIDKGSKDGISERNTVIYQGYLIGNVLKTENSTSSVKTIESETLEIPAETLKNGTSGIYSCENFTCYFDKVLTSSNLNVGDTIITSGVTEDYKRGFIIGKVLKIESTPENPFKRALISKDLNISLLTKLSIITNEK